MRTKRVIVFVVSLALALACAFELYSAARNWFAHPAQRISPDELHVVQRSEQWFGTGRSRSLEAVTIGTVNEERAVIIGDTTRDGWILPALHPDIYRSEMPQVTASMEIFQAYHFPPFITYAIGAAVVGALLVFSAFISIGCVRCETI